MITIERWYRENCTLGLFTVDDFQCWSLELPWLNNKENLSCIPEGYYEYFLRNSPRNGRCLELRNVEDRTHIQVHSGNFTYQIDGCVLVGDSIKFLDQDNIPDVTNSRNTLKKVLKLAGSSGEMFIK